MEPLQNTQVLSPWNPGVFSLAIYGFFVLILVAILLFLAGWL
jgi:hypothetical protein